MTEKKMSMMPMQKQIKRNNTIYAGSSKSWKIQSGIYKRNSKRYQLLNEVVADNIF